MRENDWTRVLGWPGYKVYRAEIEEPAKRLNLWVRRKRGNKQLICSGCGELVSAIAETYEREVRDLPWSEYLTTVVVELYRLRWQRLKPMEKLANMLLNHLEGILNYCRTKVRLGVVEAVNGNIKALLRRGRGYRNLNYLLLKAQRLAATRTEFVAFQKAA
jgi:hypothetical protein